MASRGSVIPLFLRADQDGQAADGHRPEHDPLPDVARGVGRPGAVCVRARAAGRHLRAEGAGLDGRRPGAGAARAASRATTPIRIIGTRHGEKLYESLVSREEMARAEDWATTTAFRPTRATSTTTSISSKARREISQHRRLHLAQHRAPRRRSRSRRCCCSSTSCARPSHA